MREWLDLSCLFFFNLWPFWIVIAAAAAAAAYTALLRHRDILKLKVVGMFIRGMENVSIYKLLC